MLRRLSACSAGAVAVITAMVLPVLLGFASLGTEVGHWYLVEREMQGSADAAALSAAAQWIADGGTGTTYQQVGVDYASINGGFTIPTSNVCLYQNAGDCSSILALDSRAIVCTAPPCVVVEITQSTMNWLTTIRSLEPKGAHLGRVQSIPTPTLKARAIVSLTESTQTVTTTGTDCILALDNNPAAVTVVGGGDLVAKCGVAIDGGIDQNVNGTAKGGITFSGANAKAEVNALVIAGNSTESQECLYANGQHCYLYNSSFPNGGSTTLLPAADFKANTATADPYAAAITAMFQKGGIGIPPSSVETGGVALKTAGSNYSTNGTCTFTIVGGTYYGATSSPAAFTATVSGGKVTSIGSVTDPGAYSVFPTSPVTATTSCSGAKTTSATFTLTEGCFTWNGTPIPNRKYCSIFMHGQDAPVFGAGNYWIAGGDSNCIGFCSSGKNVNATSAVAGVTFFLTTGDGPNSLGANSLAYVSIQSGTVKLCSPGTNCGTTCNNATPTSCMLFIQNPLANVTVNNNNVFNGNGTNTLAGLVYLRHETFQTNGTSTILGCFGVIAYDVNIGGTPEFSNGCLPGNGIGGTTTTVTNFSNPILYQ